MTFAFSERKKRTDCCGLRINLTLKKKNAIKSKRGICTCVTVNIEI